MNRIHQETNNSLSRVSVQDTIVAYAVNLYNSFIINDPITTVRFILTYRRRDPEESSSYRDANNVGNGIYFLEVPVAELPGLADKASAFRKAIVHSRERPNLEALISARSALGFEMMQKRQIMPWSVPGMTLVNGLHHFDYAEEASFGYPGRAQAYYSSCCCRYLTLTKPNPVQLADGSWKWHVGDVGVGIPVPDGLKEKMLQQKAQDMEGLLHSF
ncbi:hypothetical protein BDP27DRAFT_209983 [Rhodocollybia butyracea]|uniref:Uncharacterized protein n=1 Tax=Rhodocollybia butyracea TaxID=206335 RepID=A0A9P5PKS6_9AGAR|nr:hypothetical protein BDP27DRAFT_209983 [Rhodocollybia butyracea]